MDKSFIKSVFWSLGLLSFFLMTEKAGAQELVSEDISGADRSFTYGYTQEKEARSFETIIDERNEKEAAEAKPQAEAGDVDADRWKIYKSFRVSALYESNLFSSHSDPIDDTLFIYSPTLGFSHGKPGRTKSFFQTFLNLGLVDYVENDKLSRVNQTYATEAGWRGEKWNLNFSNHFQPVSAFEAGERTELIGSSATRTISTSDSAQVRVAYHWMPKTDLTADYTYEIRHFPIASNKNNQQVHRFSYQSNRIEPGIVYRLNSRNVLDARVYVSADDYYEGGGFSSRIYGMKAGWWHRLTPKTDIRFSGGYEWRDYFLDAIPSSEGPVYSVFLSRQLTPKVTLTLSYSHRQAQEFDFVEFAQTAESFDSNSDSYRADLHWKTSAHTTLRTFFAIEDSSRDRQYTIPDDENPSSTQTGPIEDQVYRMGLEWAWQSSGPWSCYVSYEYLNKFSSFRTFQYDDQRLGGYVRKAF